MRNFCPSHSLSLLTMAAITSSLLVESLLRRVSRAHCAQTVYSNSPRFVPVISELDIFRPDLVSLILVKLLSESLFLEEVWKPYGRPHVCLQRCLIVDVIDPASTSCAMASWKNFFARDSGKVRWVAHLALQLSLSFRMPI